MVLDGHCSEEQSHDEMRKIISDAMAQTDLHKKYQNERKIRQAIEHFKQTSHPKKIYEKEYYFDEGLGETLEDHIKNITSNYPEIQVTSRKDAEGFTIVRTQYKPKFKYDLDKVLNFDADTERAKIKESMEDLLQEFLPIGAKAKDGDFSKVDKKTLENAVKLLMPFTGKD